jgi:aryl-phospho-beta-D-glucosidase BglC (GH1 family)
MNKVNIKSAYAALMIGLTLTQTGVPVRAQSSTSVPSSYTTEYAQLNQIVDNFITQLDSRTPSTASITVGTELDQAAAGKGLSLLNKTAITNVQQQIACYKKLGVSAVQIPIGFPVLCQEFWTQKMNNQADFNAFVSFYEQVVAMCHSAGLKVLVEAHPVYPGQATDIVGQNAESFSQSLSPTLFQQYMAEHVGNIASLVKPDSISIVAEPDTELFWTGQAAYKTPAAMASLVQAATNAITKANATNHTQILAAAGCDSWTTNALAYNTQLYGVAGLGAIDLHTYFIGGNDLQTAMALADSAHAAGKSIVVSECWLSKAGTGTPPYKPATNQAVVDRAVDSFSFWEPLDETYVSALLKWCKVENPAIFCFSYAQQLFTYQNYASSQSLSDQQIVTNELQGATQALKAGQLSPVGIRFGQLLNGAQ